MKPYLAVDWGTSNLRAWRIDARGKVEASLDLPLGVSRIALGSAQQIFEHDVRRPLDCEHLPALLCGMAGSSLGWRTAPYVDCPASIADVAKSVVLATRGPFAIAIAPGLKTGMSSAADILRGEETQIFGWLDACKPSGRALVCLPGTHSKWALVEDGRIERFRTYMTGELFALLSEHSVLASGKRAPGADDVFDDDAFDEGVDAAGGGDALSARLFRARTRVVVGAADAGSTAAYLSGLLIGAEIAAADRHFAFGESQTLTVIGAAALSAHYVRALAQRGRAVRWHQGDTAFVAGANALVRQGALDAAG
ncbi:2-dehydro-3-deoxygalactonokinase [Terricaulis sp.]|uniref:2-dehydro-3-deoxygalactonokinase n=1 Tax=Terricaulis sp. TaxID=2768686 RepID=UPI002AC7E31C|nr:2-dehydro-3-deoxygalactonokinase [Terricaulis sp.]MDZ4690234.1 2-dehydro-3-deoxygalactonokinase [Terricaulis sp.]